MHPVLYVQVAFCTSMSLLCMSRKCSARLWGSPVRPGSLLHVQGLALYVQDAFCTSRVASWTCKRPSVRPGVWVDPLNGAGRARRLGSDFGIPAWSKIRSFVYYM